MTTVTTAFSRTLNPHPVSDRHRAEILAAPGFGKYFTDHMVVVDYDEGAWHDARVVPYGPFSLDPATMVLHYAQEIFEGLKAYQQPDGSISTFRPLANAGRLNRSADRLGMPRLPEELFLASLRELVSVDSAWVPSSDGEGSLYFRPFMFATEVGLGVRPANKYTYSVIASPAGAYFPGGITPVSVWWSTEYVRAAPGGTGAAKTGGNYAASLAAQAQAAGQGCDQVVWLDAVERRWVEEMGGMNLFFVFGSGPGAEVVTPELTGSLLPGVTRDSLLQMARDLGYRATERRISTDEWAKAAESGELTEVFACGTAAVITPVGSVKHAEGGFDIAGGQTGPITLELREALSALQRGRRADPYGWMVPLTDDTD